MINYKNSFCFILNMDFDYKKLKFKAGLEIHQQLDTKKLFCNCPSVLRKDEPDFEINRRLHAVAGESGEIDVAAAYQAGLNKKFIYQGYDTTCLVELDEEPPHQINSGALNIVLQIAILLNCKILPISQIMRKTVIDGSNTSGFQRTVIVGYDGYVETEQGKVGIESIILEEDAARIVSKDKDSATFKLDRLGIPLVEIATLPDIKSPEQMKEVALHIGNILRSCNVKRGLGTIRQDVNISIKNENRVEIKGVQDMSIFIKTIENEVKRQKDLSDKKNPTKSEVRNALPDGTTEFLRPMPGSARMYPETDLPLLKISRELINNVKKNLPKLRSEIEKDLMKQGLSQEMIKMLFKQNKLNEFEELIKIYRSPMFVGKVILVFPKDIASREKISVKKVNKILNDVFADVLIALKKKKISESDVRAVLIRIVKGEKVEKALVFEKQDTGVIEERIMKLIKEKPGLSVNAYMGLVMKEFKGKIGGGEVMTIIKKYIE